jgi:DNA-binding winged helix-turn-helix (wHTH) protein
MDIAADARRVRFAAFEVDLRASELFKYGVRIKIQDQPFEVLAMLLERPGELVSREELHTGSSGRMTRLWNSMPDSTLPCAGYVMH